MLFVGVDTSNGHAYRQGDRFRVWLPIESYRTEKLIDVFITHEMLHALHYEASPTFYFADTREKDNLGRQLMTEGIATCLTQRLLGTDDLTALWADFLPRDRGQEWLRECEARSPELVGLLRRNFDLSSDAISMFHAADPLDIRRYRAGYYVGLRLIEELMTEKRLTAGQLLQLERSALSRDIKTRMSRFN